MEEIGCRIVVHVNSLVVWAGLEAKYKQKATENLGDRLEKLEKEISVKWENNVSRIEAQEEVEKQDIKVRKWIIWSLR